MSRECAFAISDLLQLGEICDVTVTHVLCCKLYKKLIDSSYSLKLLEWLACTFLQSEN